MRIHCTAVGFLDTATTTTSSTLAAKMKAALPSSSSHPNDEKLETLRFRGQKKIGEKRDKPCVVGVTDAIGYEARRPCACCAES